MGNFDNDAQSEIVIGPGPGPGGGPHVAIWEYDDTYINDFYSFDRKYKVGIRVSVGNVRTSSLKEEILIVPASKGSPLIRMFNNSGSLLSTYYFMERWWKGYHDVAAGNGMSMAATGVNRRDSIRQGIE